MKVVKIFYVLVRYDIPLWIVGLLTNWWPDNRITIRMRGMLFRHFMFKCGKKFSVAKNVQLKGTNGLTLGNNVYLATGVWLNGMGTMVIEDDVVMGPYVVISSGIHGFKDNSVRFGGTVMAPVKIGKGTWLSAHVIVKAGVKIGSGVLVTGNAAVTYDLPDNVLAGGVPAKVIRKRENTTSDVRYSRF